MLLLSTHDAALREAGVDNVRSLFEALAIRRAAGDRRGMAVALHGLGGLHFRLFELDAARACFEETLAIGRELEDDRLVAASLNNLANVALNAINRGEPPPEGLDARSLYEESVRLWRTLGDELATAAALGDLAWSPSTRGGTPTHRRRSPKAPVSSGNWVYVGGTSPTRRGWRRSHSARRTTPAPGRCWRTCSAPAETCGIPSSRPKGS